MVVPLGMSNLAVKGRENIPKVPVGSFKSSVGLSIYSEGHATTSSELGGYLQLVI